MDIEFHTHKKLGAIVAQIEQLLLSDFPHPASENALKLLLDFFRRQITRLANASNGDPRIVKRVCITVNERILQFLPILGFLLRSTNVRNNFEAYDAFVQLSESLIGPHAQVVLSSEWDYSPLTYPMNVSVLPDFVLLGMPASESTNALILPLAGHELGHSVWQNDRVDHLFRANIQNEVRVYIKANWHDFTQAYQEHTHLTPTDHELSNNLFLVNIIAEIVQLCLCQVEETFCDAIGIRLFAESYAHAFHYLLAPSLGGYRSLEYPRLAVRAEFIALYGDVNLPQQGFSNYPAEFDDLQPSLTPREEFVSRAADKICRDLACAVFAEAKRIVEDKAPLFLPSNAAAQEILEMFEKAIPARTPRSLADIVNAGWAYVRLHGSTFTEDERPLCDWVSELILKSIEVLEFRRRIQHA